MANNPAYWSRWKYGIASKQTKRPDITSEARTSFPFNENSIGRTFEILKKEEGSYLSLRKIFNLKLSKFVKVPGKNEARKMAK